MKPTNVPAYLIVVAILVAVSGCGSDERLVAVSERGAERQAEQNLEIARQSQAVADATQTLVEADAKSRAELLKANEDFQTEVREDRANRDRQHEQLEAERKSLAAARVREPLIANAITAAALLLACLLPLGVAIYVLRALDAPVSDEVLGELLVQEIAAANSPLFMGNATGGKTAIAGTAAPLLPPADKP